MNPSLRPYPTPSTENRSTWLPICLPKGLPAGELRGPGVRGPPDSYLFQLPALCPHKHHAVAVVNVRGHGGHAVPAGGVQRQALHGRGAAQRLVDVQSTEVVIDGDRLEGRGGNWGERQQRPGSHSTPAHPQPPALEQQAPERDGRESEVLTPAANNNMSGPDPRTPEREKPAGFLISLWPLRHFSAERSRGNLQS